MRTRLGGGSLELVAWGFRNPFGLAFAPDGRLYVTDNAYDKRGSRPVFGAGDQLFVVEQGRWYGWPDYHGGRTVASGLYEPPGGEEPRRVLARDPRPPSRPVALFAVHSSSNGIDFSRSTAFGHVGDAFVAQFGDMATGSGKVLGPVGFKVVRVDVTRGVVHDFAINRGRQNGPATKVGGAGIGRPVAVRCDPAGNALYVVDFGVMTIGDSPQPYPETGVIWRITRSTP